MRKKMPEPIVVPFPLSTPKPIKIIKGKGRHKTETRVFPREIRETFCVHPSCKFKGQHAVQGVCFRDREDVADWKKIRREEKRIEEELKYFRKKFCVDKMKDPKEYIEWLESMYTTAQMNWSFVLDEVIRLRRDNTLLKVPFTKIAPKKPKRKLKRAQAAGLYEPTRES
jgi:hypothetical protein